MGISIPPELVALIINASVDPYDPVSFDSSPADRYTTLKSYNLVDSTWKAFSEPLLYEYVVIGTASASLAFIDACEAKGGGLTVVRSMRLIGNLGFNRAARLLECVGGELENLALHSVVIDVQDLAPLQRLKRLFLAALSFQAAVDLVPTFSLPLLAHFDCSNVLLRNSSTPFFNPTFTPALRAVSLHRISAASLPELDEGFSQTIPTLHHMSVDSPHVYQTVLPIASNLLLLDVAGIWGTDTIFHSISTAPRFLRIYGEFADQVVAAVLVLRMKQRLRQWAPYEEVFVDCADSGIEVMATEQMTPHLKELKYQVTEGPVFGSDGFWRTVEKVEKIVQKRPTSAA